MSTSSAELKDYDLEEKGAASPLESGEVVSAHDGVNRDAGAVAWLWRISKKLDSYGVEVRGVERVPEHERNHPSYFDAGFLWMSANMTISTFSLGTLGISLNGLNSTDACLTILFFNLLTTLPVATFSTWGKCTGLRQMIIGRFSFGPWTILFPILLNCLACIGWSTINTIVGASALHNVTTHNQLPEPAGIVIIALITLAVALFGYRWVHALERYASIPVFVIFIIMFGQAGRFMEGGFAGAGEAEAAAVLSFGGTIAGFALGWTSLAADYTVNFPVETPSWKVWLATYFGLNFPMILIECLGALMMSTFKNKPTWGESYESQGESLGALLAAPLVGPMGGFGRFLLVILALSIVANNIPNVYSFALTFQSFGRYAQAIPRFFLCIVCTAIYIALAEAGYNSFHDAFDLLLVLLAYWLAIYSAVLLLEHFIFRRGSFSNYDLDAYNTYKKLPVGLAAFGGCACGVAGAVVGMAQKWYIGPLGASFGGPFGADIGFELAFGFTCVGYPPLRYLERKYTGR
ncbi:uncharacterized protein JCM10292_000478 [Rhodotorula paludigena]|uniref:uncharacterized protein n=1 Tax=Rhodotorula paludigena TaxID=86838 RepID=UPI00317DC21C